MSQEKNKRALFVGGHLSPALAVIEELQSRGGWKIFWVGRRLAMETGLAPSLEYEVIPQLGIPFFDLKTGRLQRRFSSETMPSLLRVVPGLLQAFTIVVKVRPQVVVSFGGYLSVPVVLAASLFRIPVVLHEQTTVSGLGNRIAARFASKIAVSFITSANEFPKSKVVVTGNPVRRSILDLTPKKTKTPVIYITGGGQGSQTINKVLEELLPELTQRFFIVHQTGFLDYEHFTPYKKKYAGKYDPQSTIMPNEVAKIYQRAAIVISRAGANTVAEIAAVGVPAILIPIPWSARGEQEKNAELLAGTGLAVVLSQKDLSKKSLLLKINYLFSNLPSKEARTLARRLVNPQAAVLVANLVEKLSKV